MQTQVDIISKCSTQVRNIFLDSATFKAPGVVWGNLPRLKIYINDLTSIPSSVAGPTGLAHHLGRWALPRLEELRALPIEVIAEADIYEYKKVGNLAQVPRWNPATNDHGLRLPRCIKGTKCSFEY